MPPGLADGDADLIAAVELCRVELDPERREEALLQRLGDDAETLVAFALEAP